MNDEKRLKAVEWFKNRAKNCPMPATRRMYEIAIEALEEPKVKDEVKHEREAENSLRNYR